VAVDLKQPVDQVEEQMMSLAHDQNSSESCKKKPLLYADEVLHVYWLCLHIMWCVVTH